MIFIRHYSQQNTTQKKKSESQSRPTIDVHGLAGLPVAVLGWDRVEGTSPSPFCPSPTPRIFVATFAPPSW